MPVGRAPRGWIVCTLVLLGALPAAASQGGPPRLETGREWLARCGAPAETADGGQTPCLAWVEGLIDINEIIVASARSRRRPRVSARRRTRRSPTPRAP